MVVALNEEPKDEAVVLMEMVFLMFIPALGIGLFIAALGGTENFLPGALIGGVVGLSLAKIRWEVHGARAANAEDA